MDPQADDTPIPDVINQKFAEGEQIPVEIDQVLDLMDASRDTSYPHIKVIPSEFQSAMEMAKALKRSCQTASMYLKNRSDNTPQYSHKFLIAYFENVRAAIATLSSQLTKWHCNYLPRVGCNI